MGETMTDINDRLRAIRREDFEHLRGQAITVTEAAEKYGVVRQTIGRWVNKGYVNELIPDSYPMRIDESDLAYCAAIHTIRKKYKSRAPLLDVNGKPYLLMHPDLAKARRLVSTGL